jgi:hypothetical protein
MREYTQENPGAGGGVDALARGVTYRCLHPSCLEAHHRFRKSSHHLENKYYVSVEQAKHDSLHIITQ